MSIRKSLKKSYLLNRINDIYKNFYYGYFLSDEKAIQRIYKSKFGKETDLFNPVTYNEKIQWLKLNWYDKKAIQCADKYEVRKFVEERIGNKYLNEIYGIYENVEQIDFDKLPDSFVLKATHASGFNIICENKNNLEFKKAKRDMKRWLKIKYHLKNVEWVYKEIRPRIICEKFLDTGNNSLPKDYKFFCFNGEPKFMFVASDRNKGTKFDFYDLQWSKLPVSQYYPNSDYIEPKPAKLDELIELSKKLSKGFPHVRVDFYICQGEIIFGEMTFFHFSGTKKFNPDEYDRIFGEYIDISKISNKIYTEI